MLQSVICGNKFHEKSKHGSIIAAGMVKLGYREPSLGPELGFRMVCLLLFLHRSFFASFFSKVGAGESQQENETYMHRYHRMRKDKQGVFLGVIVLYLVQDRSGKCLLLG